MIGTSPNNPVRTVGRAHAFKRVVVGSSPTSGGGRAIPWARPRSLKEMEISRPINGKNDCYYILRGIWGSIGNITVICRKAYHKHENGDQIIVYLTTYQILIDNSKGDLTVMSEDELQGAHSNF